MKAGTAQKLVLNMLSTSVMIKIGRVEDNRMVNMQLTNDKLIDRGTKMIMESTGLSELLSYELLIKNGSVKKAPEEYQLNSKIISIPPNRFNNFSFGGIKNGYTENR